MKRNKVQQNMEQDLEDLKDKCKYLEMDMKRLRISIENKYLAEKDILVYDEKKVILLRNAAPYRTKGDVSLAIMETATKNNFTNFACYDGIPLLQGWKVFLGGRELV